MMTREEFGQRLYGLMIAKGWWHAELARRADLPRNNISTYIDGRSYPGAKSLGQLARALGMQPEELLPGSDSKVRGARYKRDLPATEIERRLAKMEETVTYLLVLHGRGVFG